MSLQFQRLTQGEIVVAHVLIELSAEFSLVSDGLGASEASGLRFEVLREPVAKFPNKMAVSGAYFSLAQVDPSL
jgi:hypothetical protein